MTALLHTRHITTRLLYVRSLNKAADAPLYLTVGRYEYGINCVRLFIYLFMILIACG